MTVNKEKLKQALNSTARGISDDFEKKKKLEKKKKKKKNFIKIIIHTRHTARRHLFFVHYFSP